MKKKSHLLYIATTKIKYLGKKSYQGGKTPILRKLHNTEEKIKEDTNK